MAAVLQLLAFLLPLGLASAVSPMMLSEQVVLLSTRRGVPAASAYAAGTVTVAALLVAAVVGLGTGLQLPTTPHLDATLDLWLGGALLLVVGALLGWRRRHRAGPEKQRRRDVRPPAAYAFGVLAMATNITTLALLLPASKEIAASSVTEVGKLAAAALLVVLACLPAWGPLSVVAVAPRASTEVLGRIQGGIDRHGPTVILVFLGGLSLFLLGRGVYRLEWVTVTG